MGSPFNGKNLTAEVAEHAEVRMAKLVAGSPREKQPLSSPSVKPKTEKGFHE
jgi:hypothetical protein